MTIVTTTATAFLSVATILYLLIPMPRHARYVLAAVLVGGVYLISWPGLYETYRLEKEGIHTVGVLVSKNCDFEKRQTVSYRFRVGSNEYRGVGKPGAGNQSCKNFQVDDQIFITYLGSNPKINTPDREVDTDVFIGFLFAAGVFGMLVWGNGEQARFREEKRRKRKKNA